ncbi:MAG TPA: glucokinase [Candidatus Nanoarchaeia archaeon]|nr:glucokinase [Candidatus Nanoarchaeia archaeon]
MQFLKKEHKKLSKSSYSGFILGGDIGATNTHLGIFGVKNKSADLIISYHFKNKDLSSVYEAINFVLNLIKKNYKIKIENASLGIAGALSPKKDIAKMTNIKWSISKKELMQKTKLKKIILINDFEAIGYAINSLKKGNVSVVKTAKRVRKAPILVIGAGTGLGKVILLHDKNKDSYFPVSSEAGNGDFAAQDDEDFELIKFMRQEMKGNISYEDFLSGRGIINIYNCVKKEKRFKETACTKEINESKIKPELISKYRKIDGTCKETFRIFKKIYAGFARNSALDVLPYGGIYIAGGIAPKNKEIFDREFVKMFGQNNKLSHVLNKISIYLVRNLNVGLIGAGAAGTGIK